MKKQFYFYNEDDEMCYNIEGIKRKMKEDGITEKEVFLAIRDKWSGMFWCKCFGVPCEVGGGCGKECSEYVPRNGIKGICKHHGFFYRPVTEPDLIKLNDIPPNEQ
jgi:hypothetical protein